MYDSTYVNTAKITDEFVIIWYKLFKWIPTE